MDTLLGFLLDNTGFMLGLAAGLMLGAVLMIAVMRLFAFTERTLDTPHYGPPDAPRSRVPPRNPMITGELRDWAGSQRGSNQPAPNRRPPPPPNPPPARPARGA